MLNRSPCGSLLATKDELNRWLGGAKTGDTLEYYRGLLATDRVVPGSRLPKKEACELDRVAKAAMAAAESGRACLVQRRHGDGDYSYLMIRCSCSSSGCGR